MNKHALPARMKTHYLIGSFLLLSIFALPSLPASSQTTGDSGKKSGEESKQSKSDTSKFDNKKVSLNINDESLQTAIRLLMKGVDGEYVIDNSLKAARVTLEFKDILFKDALKTLMKVSTLPVTYKIEDGIYHFMLKEEVYDKAPDYSSEPTKDGSSTTVPPEKKIDKVFPKNGNSRDIVDTLTGNTAPPQSKVIYSNAPIGHSTYSSTSFKNGVFSSSGVRNNPDGTSQATGGGYNIFGLINSLFGNKSR